MYKCCANVSIIILKSLENKNKNTNNLLFIVLQAGRLALFCALIAPFLNSCKKAEPLRLETQISWLSPALNDTFFTNELLSIQGVIQNQTYFQELQMTLENKNNKTVVDVKQYKGNYKSLAIDEGVYLDSNLMEGMYRIACTVVANEVKNKFYRSFYLSKNENNNAIVAITSDSYETSSVQLLDYNLNIIGTPAQIPYEYDRGAVWNESLYFSTKGNGGFIRMNRNQETSVVYPNSNNVKDFVHAIGFDENTVYCATTLPTKQIIGFNGDDVEKIRIGLVQDKSSSISVINSFVFSIEKPTNDNAYFINTYNNRTGGFISGQRIADAINQPIGFHFGNPNQFYFIHNYNESCRIDRLAKNLNDISSIKTIPEQFTEQTPIVVDNKEALILFKNKLVAFSSNHEVRTLRLNFGMEAIGMHLDGSKQFLLIFNETKIKVYSYPELSFMFEQKKLAQIKDVFFL